mgnify:FL=1
MKVILSRKGCDSDFGGMPGIIMPDDRIVHIPIPGDDFETIACHEVDAGNGLGNLVAFGVQKTDHCYLVPFDYIKGKVAFYLYEMDAPGGQQFIFHNRMLLRKRQQSSDLLIRFLQESIGCVSSVYLPLLRRTGGFSLRKGHACHPEEARIFTSACKLFI